MPPSNHSLLSPSSAHRWIACPPSARLTENLPGESSVYAEEGTKAHYLCEQVLRKGIAIGMPAPLTTEMAASIPGDYPDEMRKAADRYADFVAQAWWAFETEPTVRVEQPVSMSRWVPEARGTCDCLLAGDTTLHIIDFKYGAGVAVSPVQNTQMMMYALGAYDLLSRIDTIDTVKMTIVQPRIQDEPETYTMSATELLDWAENTLAPAAKQAWDGKGDFNPSKETCRWCRAYPQCRAWQDRYGALAGFVDESKHKAPELLTDDEIAHWLKQALDLADYVKTLEAYAQQRLLDGAVLPGWKLVEGRSVRQFSDLDAAFAAITASGIDEAMLYERKPITLSAAEKLLGKKRFNEVCGDYIIRPSGSPKIVPESDKRQAYNPLEGFKEVTE